MEQGPELEESSGHALQRLKSIPHIQHHKQHVFPVLQL